jgi:hypothetical protein
MDCSDQDPGQSLGAQFPAVQFRHFEARRSIPELRREGIHASCGEVVALTESWMEPCAGWVESLREAHRQYPDAPAVGGPISFPCGRAAASRIEWADYFSEYCEQIPGGGKGREVRPVERISGANCSYKRWALEECRDLVEQGAWETLIHERLRKRGHELKRAESARVCYQRSARLGDLLRQRFCHGRGHGAVRMREAPWIERLARGATAPLVPWVLLGRQWRGLPPGQGLARPFLAAVGWTLALNTAWALGEAAGSWFGHSRSGLAV